MKYGAFSHTYCRVSKMGMANLYMLKTYILHGYFGDPPEYHLAMSK